LISEATRQQVTELFAASDKNGDGRLEHSEFPPDRLQYFEPVDLDSDGFVTPGASSWSITLTRSARTGTENGGQPRFQTKMLNFRPSCS